MRSLIEDELAVLRSLLEGQAPVAVQAQIDILQRLLDHLDTRCNAIRIRSAVNEVQDAVADLVGEAREIQDVVPGVLDDTREIVGGL